MRGGKSLFLLIVSLFFVSAYFSSCAKEEVAPETSTEAVAAKKKGEGSLEKDVDPNAGCQCYMSVTGTANMGDWFWTLEDATDPYANPGFALGGDVSGWFEQGSSGGYQPYPSPYFPLTPPDAGCHQFLYAMISGSAPLPTNATVFTVVKCYDAQGTLQTSVSYPFVFSDGIPEPVFPNYVYIWRLMSCEALTYDESYHCGRQGSGGDF